MSSPPDLSALLLREPAPAAETSSGPVSEVTQPAGDDPEAPTGPLVPTSASPPILWPRTSRLLQSTRRLSAKYRSPPHQRSRRSQIRLCRVTEARSGRDLKRMNTGSATKPTQVLLSGSGGSVAPGTSTGVRGIDASAVITTTPNRASTPDGDIWSCPGTPVRSLEETEGFLVQASDDALGRVQAASSKPGSSYLIVTAQEPWIGSRTVMLPAGVVDRVDRGARAIAVRCSREQIMNAPRFENDRYQDAAYRAEVGRYYAFSGCGGPAPVGSPLEPPV
jgi:hypothetical protein